jgi:exodeoxyribonuclease VII small subunit
MTFEEKMKRLDEIVKIMSENKLPLEETISIFEEGQQLIKELKEQLKTAEEKVVKEIN